MGEAKVACQRFDGEAPYVVLHFTCTSWEQRLAVLDEAWLKKKEHWVLNELITKIYTSALHSLIPRRLLEKSDFLSECLGMRLEHYNVTVAY